MMLSLKGLNKHIEKHHFKIDTLWSAVGLMTPNCFMASIDLKDAYYSIPIEEVLSLAIDIFGTNSSPKATIFSYDLTTPDTS